MPDPKQLRVWCVLIILLLDHFKLVWHNYNALPKMISLDYIQMLIIKIFLFFSFLFCLFVCLFVLFCFVLFFLMYVS